MHNEAVSRYACSEGWVDSCSGSGKKLSQGGTAERSRSWYGSKGQCWALPFNLGQNKGDLDVESGAERHLVSWQRGRCCGLIGQALAAEPDLGFSIANRSK